MTSNKKLIVFEILIIFILGLMPLLWLSGNQLILGHDAGLTLNPVDHFLDRLFLWTKRFGFGADQTYATAGFFIHGLEALVSSFGLSLGVAQKIVFIFWFTLPGLTMYYFARSVFPNRRYLPLIASVFFMINHFLLQGWFVAERTKFSIYAAMPLVLLLIFKLFERKISALSAGILTALILFLLNGGGNLPLFGSLLVLIPLALLYFLFIRYSGAFLKKSIGYLATAGLALILLSSFWLIPYIYFVFNQFGVEVDRAGGVDGVLGWAKVISANTSFLNLMRLEGIPDWYGNPFHPYSNFFLQNPFLIAVSFALPILAFLSWFFLSQIKEKIYLLFFWLVALIGMIFAAGVHPPTGFIYELLIRFVPGFLAFRTPFYKFAPLIWFSFAILFAFTLDELLKRSEKWRLVSSLKLGKVAVFLVVLGIVFYNFPYLDGRFFDYEKERTTRVTVPQYIFDFQKWADGSDNQNSQSLLLPALRRDNKLQTYNWGYFSLTPLTALFSRATFIENAFYSTKTEDAILNGLYDNLLNNERGWEKLAALLAINNLVIRNDYRWDAPGLITRKPEEYKQTLTSSPLIYENKTFGQWQVYSFNWNASNAILSVANNLSYAEAEMPFIKYLTGLDNFDSQKPLFFKSQNKKPFKDSDFFLARADSIFLMPKCINCDLAGFQVDTSLKDPLLLPGSPFYALVVNREKVLRQNADDLPKKIDFFLNLSQRRLFEAQRMVDLKINLEFLDRPVRENFFLLQELDKILVNASDFDSEDGNDLLLRIDAYLDFERARLDEIFARSQIAEELINNNYLILVTIQNKVRSWMWATTNEDEKKYLLTVDNPGQYTFWLRRDRLELPKDQDPLKLTFSFTIDGVTYQQQPEAVDDVWIKIKKINLSKGLHRITFALNPRELFEGAVDTFDGKLPSFLTLDNGIYTLTAQGNKNCVPFKAGNLITGQPYRISFKHRKVKGDQKLRVFISQKQETINPLTRVGGILEQEPNWRDFQIDKLLTDSDAFYINICAEFYRDPIYTQNTIIEISDLNVRKLSSPVFIFEKEVSAKNSTARPDMKFGMINQTKYKIEIKEAKQPFFLTFSQRFSPDWKVYLDNGAKTELAEENHVIGNGYANTWYIDKTGDFTLTVEYKPQRLFYLAIAISAIAFIAALSILLIKRRNL